MYYKFTKLPQFIKKNHIGSIEVILGFIGLVTFSVMLSTLFSFNAMSKENQDTALFYLPINMGTLLFVWGGAYFHWRTNKKSIKNVIRRISIILIVITHIDLIRGDGTDILLLSNCNMIMFFFLILSIKGKNKFVISLLYYLFSWSLVIFAAVISDKNDLIVVTFASQMGILLLFGFLQYYLSTERAVRSEAEYRIRLERDAREFVLLYNHEVGGLFKTLDYTLKELRQADRDTATELWGSLDEATHEINLLLGEMDALAREGRTAALRRESLAIHGLVHQAISNVQVIHPSVRFETEIVIPTIPGDRTYMLRAIETGVRNAAQAVDGMESAFVLISVFPEDEVLVIRIEDNGLGFAPEVLSHVEASLANLPLGVSTKEEGSGRGLPLMQRVALLHGGTLVLGNGEGGAWVEIRFPAY